MVADLAALQIVTQVQLYGIDDIVNGTVLSTSILEPSTVVADGFADLKDVGSLVLMLNPAGAIEGKPFAVQPTLQVLSPDVSTVLLPVSWPVITVGSPNLSSGFFHSLCLLSITLTVNPHIHHMKQLKHRYCCCRPLVVTFVYYPFGTLSCATKLEKVPLFCTKYSID